MKVINQRYCFFSSFRLISVKQGAVDQHVKQNEQLRKQTKSFAGQTQQIQYKTFVVDTSFLLFYILTKFDMFCKLSSGKICFIANPLALIILLAPSK